MSTRALTAAWLPGLPHLLCKDSPRWVELGAAVGRLGEEVRASKPDVLILYSTQWISVLGTSFQAHPNPKGIHVDENWYTLGDLPFDFKTDAKLSEAFAASVKAAGFPAKTVNYDEFPIDTGTIVALRLLDPHGTIPVSVVSSWVYADSEKSRRLGQLMHETLAVQGKKGIFVAVSSLSTRFFTDDIDPADDKVSHPEDEKWNQSFLGLIESGELAKAACQAAGRAKQAPVDMQLNAFHWLTGVLPERAAGRVLAYGPIWGTGNAVLAFTGEER